MKGRDRFRLPGSYRAPRFRYGGTVRCAVRGEVEVVGLHEAPIPWPVGKRGRARSLVVFKDLARAVRRESEVAVAHHWGVDKQTVGKWRKALGVGRVTEGTSKRLSDHAREPAVVAGLRKAQAKSGDPARRAKLSAALRGRKMDRRVVEALAAQRRGTRHQEESRRKMSETHRRRGTLVPGTVVWTKAEDRLVRSLPAAEAARRTGRTLVAVWQRRRVLGVPDGRRKESKRR
jgi:hypothetical protein